MSKKLKYFFINTIEKIRIGGTIKLKVMRTSWRKKNKNSQLVRLIVKDYIFGL